MAHRTKLPHRPHNSAPKDGSKQDRTRAIDADTGELVQIFHPRQQNWYEHFAWSSDGTRLLGITACGRATVALLRLNRPLAVAVRAHWVSIRRHPPRQLLSGDREDKS